MTPKIQIQEKEPIRPYQYKDLCSTKIKNIEPQTVEKELNGLMNYLYAIIAVNENKRLSNEELMVCKSLIYKKLSRYSIKFIKNAFEWYVTRFTNKEERIYRIDYPTIVKVVKAKEENERLLRIQNPKQKEEPKQIRLDPKVTLQKFTKHCIDQYKEDKECAPIFMEIIPIYLLRDVFKYMESMDLICLNDFTNRINAIYETTPKLPVTKKRAKFQRVSLDSLKNLQEVKAWQKAYIKYYLQYHKLDFHEC